MTQLVALSTSNTTSRLSPCAFSGSHIYLPLRPPSSPPSFLFCNTLLLPPSVSSIISRRASGKRVLLDPARPTLLAFGESTTSARQPKPSTGFTSLFVQHHNQHNLTLYTIILRVAPRPPLEAGHHLASQLFLILLPPTLTEDSLLLVSSSLS